MSWNAANIWKKIHMERRLSCWVNYHRMRGGQGGGSYGLDGSRRKLGEAITAEQSPDLPVWIFADNPYIGKAGEMKQGLTEVLEKQGFSYTIVPRGTDDPYRSVIEKTVYPGSGTAVVAALDFASTAEAAEIVGGSSVATENTFPGYTASG